MVDKYIFNAVVRHHSKGLNNNQLAEMFKLSERTVRRILEAGTWERWPYIQAKKQYGYMTPEYKAYLKRQSLPLTPPRVKAKTTTSNKSLIGRFRRWIHYHF